MRRWIWVSLVSSLWFCSSNLQLQRLTRETLVIGEADEPLPLWKLRKRLTPPIWHTKSKWIFAIYMHRGLIPPKSQQLICKRNFCWYIYFHFHMAIYETDVIFEDNEAYILYTWYANARKRGQHSWNTTITIRIRRNVCFFMTFCLKKIAILLQSFYC